MAKTYYPFHAIVKNEVELTDSGYDTTLTLHNDESIRLSDEPNQNALASVEGTMKQEMFWTDDSRPAPKIIGADNVSIWEGETFDPMAGVSAVDWEGNTVPVTYTGTVDPSTPGTYRLNYEAVDADGRIGRKTRTVTVKELEAPHFTGITPISVKQGAAIDLEAGVKAWLGSTEISYTYSPTSVVVCNVGTTTVTYTATGNGKTTTVDREVTISQANPPVISGNTPLYVYINTDFDPLDGLTAVDANGNPVPVELDDNLFVLTKTVGTTNTQINYIEGTVVPLRKPVLSDRERFDGWYDNPTMTGTPITEVTMTANKQVWCKIVNLDAYASYDSATTTFRMFTDESGKYTNGQVVGTVTYYAGWEDDLNMPWTGSSVTWQPDVTTVRIDNVIHPVGMTKWFSGFTSLTQITGLWRIDTSAVTHMTDVFRNCTSLAKHLDLSTWETTNTRFFGNMFRDSGITSVDISSFVVGTGADTASYMFNGCSALTTIYTAPGYDLSGIRLANAMFTGCTNLVGGEGTVYDSTKVNAEYAKVDGGPSAPGYFTER